MAHKYKAVFERVNESRNRRGLVDLTWAEFIRKDPKMIYREKIRMQDYVEPDQRKKIQRPPAVYDNKSVYDKYGV